MHLFTCNTTHISTQPDRFNLSSRYSTTIATCTTVYGQKYRLGVDELLEYNCGGISINTLIVIRITRLSRGLGGGEARAYSIININKEHWSCVFLVPIGDDISISRGGGHLLLFYINLYKAPCVSCCSRSCTKRITVSRNQMKRSGL